MKMKKEQLMYIGIGLLVVFVFMLVTMNSSSVSRDSYSGYSFNNGLARTAARSQESFLSGSSLKSNEKDWRIQDYLDDSRGPDCASKSFGITASGGPVCLTSEQARAMASRGFNTVENR